MENKESQYKYVLAELKSFYEKYNNKQYRLSLNSKYTSIVSLLKNHVSGLFFVGFYEVVEVVDLQGNKTGEKYLEIGAYQSTILATPRIAYGKGQCGQCWEEKKVQLVDDVKECKNYIACDDETQSEIVLPVFRGDEVIAVLDIDSDQKARFDQIDVEYLYDILPFIFAYGALLMWYMSLDEEIIADEESILMMQIKKQTFENEILEVPQTRIESMESIYVRLSFIGVAFLHSLIYLGSHWSTDFRSFICYWCSSNRMTLAEVKKYQYVKASFKKHTLKYSDIIPIQNQGELKYVRFMENIYIFDQEKNNFQRMKPNVNFKISAIDKKIFENQLVQQNTLFVPMKKFSEIFKEQLMEPFSFFQIFSVSLWLLDESRMVALFTLSMLFMSSFSVVITRMKNMLTIRQMKLNPQIMTVWRNKRWTKISSYELVAGDICLLHTADQAKPFEKDGSSNQLDDEKFLRRQIPFSEVLPEKLFKTEQMIVSSHKSVPCDILLLNGNVVVNEAMLTGESIPQVKDSIEKVEDHEHLDIKNKHKQSIIYCGTEIIQVQGNSNYEKYVEDKGLHPHCLGLVLRTGFDTAKGKLIRTVFYNTENASLQQTDGLVIIGVLLIFGLISSFYVLYYGLENESRDKNKLFLRCLIIVTTVVPPELPMILSIAVNQSIAFLQMRKIFCTEPFRIPYAGKVEVLAFDKTGTLTNDTLQFKGIVDGQDMKMNGKTECSIKSQSVLAGCHQLIFADQKLQGDPIEVLFFQQNQHWNYDATRKQAYHKDTQTYIQIRNIFSFKSDLKRMSTLVEVDLKGQRSMRLLVKGAPEALDELLFEKPHNFKEVYQNYANLGYRVLCLADRDFEQLDDGDFHTFQADLMKKERDKLERQLVFRGFLICESPLKKDTIQWMNKFRQSYFVPIIITGDNMLTAIAVAKQVNLNIINGKQVETYILDFINKQFQLRTHENEQYKVLEGDKILQHFKNQPQSLNCLTSTAMTQLFDHHNQNLNQILLYFQVFARMSPKQKEIIVVGIKNTGRGVLMCGDGTNDVGALKKAHVGVALVTNQNQVEEVEKDEDEVEEKQAQLSFFDQIKEMKKQQEEMRKKMMEAKGDKDKLKNLANQQMASAAGSLFETGQSYNYGDACIAAPFTSKQSTSIRCVYTILKQGVCTLVTTICTYKILALQSILGAYSFSALHIDSLKMSEFQLTMIGILGTAYYFNLSSAKPQRYLSNVKPSFTIFEYNFVFSLVAQVVLHLYALHYAVKNIAQVYRPPEDELINNDKEFKATFQNTVIFLFQTLQQSCIFLFNHPGEPHMQKLDPKTKYFKSLLFPLVFCITASFNIEQLNELFGLKFPDNEQASIELSTLFIGVTLINYGIERIAKYMKYQKFYGFI